MLLLLPCGLPVLASEPVCPSMDVFVRDGCPHCADARIYLQQLQQRYPDLNIRYHEVNSDPQPGDVVVPVQTEISSLSDEVEERKRAYGTFAMNTGRSGLRVTIFNENREGLDSGVEEETRGSRLP